MNTPKPASWHRIEYGAQTLALALLRSDRRVWHRHHEFLMMACCRVPAFPDIDSQRGHSSPAMRSASCSRAATHRASGVAARKCSSA